MNLIPKWFKKPEIDIDALLKAENINSSIIKIDTYISKLCDYGDSLEKLSKPQANFFLNQELERSVNMDGFEGFFEHECGQYAHETVDALMAIGASKTAKILIDAISLFPNKTVPKDFDKRGELARALVEEFAELGDRFMEYEDDLNDLNMAYIKAHRSEF